jgi:hypothetical protein
MSYKLFKVVKVGQREAEIKLLPYSFKNLGMAKCHAALEYGSNAQNCLDIVVRDDLGNLVFRANAHTGGIHQSYLDRKKKFRPIMGDL